MKKKIISIALVICLVAVAVVGASLAYFTDADEAENVFTVGNVKIELTEPGWDAEGSVDAPEVYPGEALKKDPTVENIGANPCFVRIGVTGLDCLGNAGMITYETAYVANALGADWVKEGDYFYYTKVLQPGDVTSKLFEQIRIPTALTNGDGETELSIDVIAEAVQAQGAKAKWADVQTMTVAEIAAWFATCGL